MRTALALALAALVYLGLSAVPALAAEETPTYKKAAALVELAEYGPALKALAEGLQAAPGSAELLGLRARAYALRGLDWQNRACSAASR